MLNYLYEYGWIAVGLALVGYYFYRLYIKHGWSEVRKKVYELMLVAEKQFNIGEQKLYWVADNIYNLLPNSAKFVLKKKDLINTVQYIYDTSFDFMDDGKINNSN